MPAIKYIHSNYVNEKINISKLAVLCNISETTFREIFNATLGTSPVKYINNLKLSRAAELLKSNMYSVHEAMEMSGFQDEAYFSRAFKKHFGVPPKEFQIKNNCS